jgi:hypothetical protein
MKIIRDSIFGEISYDYGWVRTYTIQFFGEEVAVELIVPCVEGDEIEQAQYSGFSDFDNNNALYMQLTEAAIFEYYLSVYEECGERFGKDLSDELAPALRNKVELKRLVQPIQVIIQQSFGADDRVVGLLFSASWEPELGLAVKFLNGKIDKIGTQDIVL